MFATPHQKNPVSGSDPKQGAAYNFVLVYLIEGMIDDGLKLCGVKVDVDDNFETARKVLDARNESLDCFKEFTDSLKFHYKKSLLEHFGANKDEADVYVPDDGNAEEGEEGGDHEEEEGGDDYEEEEGGDDDEDDYENEVYYSGEGIAKYKAPAAKSGTSLRVQVH